MSDKNERVRVLYSFPLRLGAEQDLHYRLAPGERPGGGWSRRPASFRPLFPGRFVPGVRVSPTLARGKLRLPYRIVGTMRAVALHDRIVARRIEKLAGQIDIIHTWPLGALETLKTASRLGIPTVLERCNAHTGFAMEVVQKECDRLGVVAAAGSRARLQRGETAQRGGGIQAGHAPLVSFGVCGENLPG